MKVNLTIKEYKKRYFLCKDDFGKKLYPGDIVEIYLPSEIGSTWTSEISWGALTGAWVESHPTHKKLSNNPNKQRHLYELLNQHEVTIYDGDYKQIKGYVKKIKSFKKKINK
jgi:hypothetical protein